MNAEPLENLIENIEILIGLNQKILQGLQNGSALDSLDAFFFAKAAALQALNLAAESVSNDSNSDLPPLLLLTRVHAGQALVARLETQLAVELGSLQSKQKNVSAVTKAYSVVAVDKLGINGVNIVS